jgi:molecular chaperone DnaK (HSP70)
VAEIIQTKYKINIFNNKKQLIEVSEHIIKARKALSSSKSADIIVDYLTDDISFDYTLSREEFEKISLPVLNKFKTLLDNAQSYLKTTSNRINKGFRFNKYAI